MFFRHLLPTMILAATCLSPLMAQDTQTPRLGQALRDAAAEVIEHCRSEKIDSVGVLKFLVVDDGQQFKDNVGTLNSLLADRLETALVLANDPREPITLIGDASSVAATIEGATHLTPAGREKLLAADYEIMWGGETTKPGLLVTGIVEIDPTGETMTISLLGFTNQSSELGPIGTDHLAAINSNLFSEFGKSFSTRGAFDGGHLGEGSKTSTKIPDDLPGIEQVKPTASQHRHPLTDPQSPVRLAVRYDGEEIPFQMNDNGEAMLPEPRENQQIELTIMKDSTPARYGVVVKVNGVNTLYRQQSPDAACAKWVLSKPGTKQTIRGFQLKNNKELERFKVLGKSASKDREVDYGFEVGTISITVFPETETPKLVLDDSIRESKIVESAKKPKQPSSTFGALKAKLLASANRGLIVEGQRAEGKLTVKNYQFADEPVMTATATYYSAKK